MRIISLLPAATEWVHALGAGSTLVGRSHSCDTPRSVRSLPAVTREHRTGAKADNHAIDRESGLSLQQGGRLYDVDVGLIRSLHPDLIVMHGESGGVSKAWLEAHWAAGPGPIPRLFSMAPTTLKQVMDAVLRLGRTLGRLEAAMKLMAAGEGELRALREQWTLSPKAGREASPTVACITGMEPLRGAGLWMPDVVEHAGGQAVLAEKGHPSPTITMEALRQANPDVIAVIPDGVGVAEIRANLHALTEQEGWQTLKAVRQGRVYGFDGQVYFNRPGPRLYRSIALLASVLHPEKVSIEADAEDVIFLTDQAFLSGLA